MILDFISPAMSRQSFSSFETVDSPFSSTRARPAKASSEPESAPGSPTLEKDLSFPPTRAPSPVQDPFQGPPQHSRFFIQDEMAVFLVSANVPTIHNAIPFIWAMKVEGVLFRVHRHFLDRESSIFPKGTGSTNQPIELPGVTQAELESLLVFFYDGYVQLSL